MYLFKLVEYAIPNSSVQFSCSVVSNSLQPHGLQHARLPITNSWSLFKLMFIELVMPSNNLILCCPLLLLPSIFSSIRVFSSESVLHIMWPKYWSFSFSISLPNEYSGLISFRMDWLNLLELSRGLSRVLFNTTVQKHQFFCAQPSLWAIYFLFHQQRMPSNKSISVIMSNLVCIACFQTLFSNKRNWGFCECG